MDISITIGELLKVAGIIVALWGAYKVIMEAIERIGNKHDREQKWDDYDKQIKTIKDEQCLMTYCMLAMLDGMEQLGAKESVAEAKEKLSRHINQTAHKVSS